MELSILAKKSNLQIQKVRSLQYLTVRKVHYYIVNLAYIRLLFCKWRGKLLHLSIQCEI